MPGVIMIPVKTLLRQVQLYLEFNRHFCKIAKHMYLKGQNAALSMAWV